MNEATKLIESMAPVFALATTGFEEFYKQAGKKGSGDYSQSASSGNSSKSASSGNYSQSASSGNSSKSASSGYSSKSASSGYSSQSASSGDYSQSASSGNSSQSASSGYYSKSASSGNSSQSASSGYSSQSASSGYYSKSASSGDSSKSASSGERSAASALGYRAAVMGDMGNLLMCSEYAKQDGLMTPIGGLCGIVDGKILKPGRWYIVESGAWKEVDFTDGIFSYVLSTRKGVKKVRTDNGDVLYIVGDGNGNFAHGKTIKQAKEGLVFKVTAKFDGKMPKSATGAEWIGLYRAITGACAEGCKQFVKGKNIDLAATYTAKQVAEIVAGAYGAGKFAAAMKGSK